MEAAVLDPEFGRILVMTSFQVESPPRVLLRATMIRAQTSAELLPRSDALTTSFDQEDVGYSVWVTPTRAAFPAALILASVPAFESILNRAVSRMQGSP